METVLTFMLIRFAVIAGVLVVVAVVLVGAVLVLRRRGTLDRRRDQAAGLARGVARHLDGDAGGMRPATPSRRLAGAALDGVARRMEDHPHRVEILQPGDHRVGSTR